ncbi:MAG: hemolysin family protein [Dehalococcoidia bacterium]
MDVQTVIAVVCIGAASVLLAASAAAETALERANDVRIQALAARGDKRARRITSNVQQPRVFLGPLTVARVTSAAAVVAFAGYAGAREFSPFLGAVGIGLLGGAYVALLEMTVGLIAARQPEYAAVRLSEVVLATRVVFGVPAFVLALPSRILARSLRVVNRDTDTDILALVEREEASGGVEEQERRMIRGVIAMEEKSAREIMVPRIDVVAADVEESVEEVARLVNERGYSRVPVYRDNIDNIVGIVYAKDLLRVVFNGGRTRKLADLAREPRFIPESKRLDDLLREMRATRTHLAIVVDEYGGTAGLVTIEDLLEEIVGEIEDEYDVAAPRTEVISDDEALVDGGATTDVLKELFGFDIESEDFDTVGGLLMTHLGRLPQVGDQVAVGGLNIRVLSMAGRRVKRMRIARESPDSVAAPAEPAASLSG